MLCIVLNHRYTNHPLTAKPYNMLEHMKILFIIIALLLLPGLMQYAKAEQASSEKRVVAPYPRNAKIAYIESCIGLNDALAPYCKCMLDAMEKRYTLEEMQRIMMTPPAEQAKYANALAKLCAAKK